VHGFVVFTVGGIAYGASAAVAWNRFR